MRVGLEQNAQIIQGLLTSAGLECEVINKTVVEFPVPALDPRARIEIWVPEHQAAEATAVLEEARKEAAPCPSCGHMSAAEEAVCEYCGVAAT
ncbi:MAG TPA: DUF2007 domain-containing protein [Candidatus Polarisedimenticolia bacterium]|nr:DUF2007 domain-containing protein [Candidatus Polarisedimenticolia bacterium]